LGVQKTKTSTNTNTREPSKAIKMFMLNKLLSPALTPTLENQAES
jgi:hypothetical protein